MIRAYKFVGSKSFIPSADAMPERWCILTTADLASWTRQHAEETDGEGLIPATFIIATDEALWIADRRSEHLACARVGDVLAAGEMFFRGRGASLEVARVSNQSTGYCPEPSCWPMVKRVLRRIDVPHPTGFDPCFEFRRCPSCGTICILKYEDDDCPVCNTALPRGWNFTESE